MKLLALIFFFLGITLSNVGEFQTNRFDFHIENLQNISQDTATSDCADHSSHCRHHCSAVHHIILDENYGYFILLPLFSQKISFHRSVLFYQKPYLDPALKPPRLA